MSNVIIPGKSTTNKPRSEMAKILRKEGWGPGMNELQEDKCRYLEKKYGVKGTIKLRDIDKVKSSEDRPRRGR